MPGRAFLRMMTNPGVGVGAALASLALVVDTPSAYRTIAESYHALRAIHGDAVKPLFTPLLETLRDRLGPTRFATLVDDVNRARALAESTARPA